MAKINNAQIIQKLIDELKLYPGTDVIPTELAEKILPVFQINDQSINFQEAGRKRYMRNTGAGNATLTTTVPVGKKWRLDLFAFSLITDVNAANRKPRIQIKDENGNILMEGCNTESDLEKVQTASKTETYILTMAQTRNGTASVAGFQMADFSRDASEVTIVNAYTLPLMFENLVLLEGWTINIIISAGLAGDSMINMIQVNEEDNDFTS